MSADHRLDEVIRRYWEDAGKNLDVAREVLGLALAEPPTTPRVLARALTVARRAEAPGFAAQIESSLAEPMARTHNLLALIDILGDDAVDIELAVFDHLVDAS